MFRVCVHVKWCVRGLIWTAAHCVVTFLLLVAVPDVQSALGSSEDRPHFADHSGQIQLAVAPTSSLGVFLLVGRESSSGQVSGTCFYVQRPSGRYIITANHVVQGGDNSTIAARVGQTWCT